MENGLLNTALKQKILPAVTFSSAEEALPVTEAMLKGGLRVMEVTFRTGAAAEAISIIRKNLPEMYIGAGTLLSVMQVKQAMGAGAQFGLAPGFNPSVCKNALDNNFPFIPGVMTPSEIELAAEMGFGILKLFPAAQLDGVHFLRALLDPYRTLKTQFIPMGGVSLNNMDEYLQLKNVIAVGGSWLAKVEVIHAKQFEKITELVKEALLKIN
ncbi:MAG TPA: bifunctional 4-hydroxy-2-oxoglutarate aldolase/2-dehydro-3-deoxy-phosphogluconate aldolase [Chitinophagaceae bacterium]|jgi:2-dehydro-3-deoxyphosphogluconate aldolase/(4S)-4-hydroxy-2-oxoglutarate aldolase|nr:bifunctional 4-hydroxy-2-oxoglutarate aldolase/2-dehydro-3-deoxy-phosphogluconate aldolase [Chitinophagaceae bacterium]